MLLCPTNCPNFLFGWLDVIFNRDFLPLLIVERSNWPLIYDLFAECLNFIFPLIKESEKSEGVRTLYRGVLKSFLVFLHDCPEFFMEYGALLASLVPPSAIQLKNIILSAQPANVTLPDPLAFSLASLDSYKTVASSVTTSLPIRPTCDDYLNGAMNVNNFMESFKVDAIDPRTSYQGLDYERLSCAVTYLVQASSNSQAGASPEAALVALLTGILKLPMGESGLKYTFISSLVDNLSHPSATCAVAIKIILHCFKESSDEFTKELLSRCLLERLIVHRPHPWGVMVAFIELVRNPSYLFWELKFTKINPEIEKVFDAISRSCLTPITRK